MSTLRIRLRAVLLLAALAATPAWADDLPFVGTWDCQVGIFTFTPTSYDNGDEELAIREVQEGTDGSYTLFFDDDYLITLSGFSENKMGWYSHASGDNFECTRTADDE